MNRMRYFVPEATLRKVIQMLWTTDLSMKQIAQHTFCSQNIVVSINRRFQVRVVPLRHDEREKSA